MLITQLLSEFQDYMLTERGAAEATIKAYTTTIERLLEFLENQQHRARFEQIDTALLRKFIASIKNTGVKNSTIARLAPSNDTGNAGPSFSCLDETET